MVSLPDLPQTVPFIYHRARRKTRFSPPAVALSLYQLLDRKTGELKFGSRESVCEYFQIGSETNIVLSGTSDDPPLERWWGLGNKRLDALNSLRQLGVVAITSPNFSVFSDLPRWDNLHAFKRIAICWQEMVRSGLATGLHVNARSDRDWTNWAEFISDRPEVNVLAYEFATGAAGSRRMNWHAEYLCTLAERVSRPLAIIVRGGLQALPELRKSFDRVIFLDTTTFMKTVNWKYASQSFQTALVWRSAVGSGWSRETLLEHNYLAMTDVVTGNPH